MTDKQSDKGFDDLFDDSSFRTAVLLTQPSGRPRMWPKSTSQMRKHTIFGGQGQSSGGQGMPSLGDGDGAYRQFAQRKQPQRPQMWPKSPSEMRRHTSYGAQGMVALGDGDSYFKQVTQRGGPVHRGPPPAAPSKVQIFAPILTAGMRAGNPATEAPPVFYQKRSRPSSDSRQWSWKDSSSA